MLEEARAEAERLERGIDNLVNAIAMGMDPDVVMPKMEVLRRQVDAANARIRKLESESTFDREDFADFLQYGSTLTDADLMETFVHELYLNPDDITISINYADEKFEPAHVDYGQVRTDIVWLPTYLICKRIIEPARIGIYSANNLIYAQAPRAA
jgi:hypothetical protein